MYHEEVQSFTSLGNRSNHNLLQQRLPVVLAHVRHPTLSNPKTSASSIELCKVLSARVPLAKPASLHHPKWKLQNWPWKEMQIVPWSLSKGTSLPPASSNMFP